MASEAGAPGPEAGGGGGVGGGVEWKAPSAEQRGGRPGEPHAELGGQHLDQSASPGERPLLGEGGAAGRDEMLGLHRVWALAWEPLGATEGFKAGTTRGLCTVILAPA